MKVVKRVVASGKIDWKPPLKKTSNKSAPPKDTLRQAYSALVVEKEQMESQIDTLRDVLAATRSNLEDLRISSAGLSKQLTEYRDQVATLKANDEDLRAQMEFAQRQNIQIRAETEVARARGYIAGLKGEPFEPAADRAHRSISCDTADMVGGEPYSATPGMRHPDKPHGPHGIGGRTVFANDPNAAKSLRA